MNIDILEQEGLENMFQHCLGDPDTFNRLGDLEGANMEWQAWSVWRG